MTQCTFVTDASLPTEFGEFRLYAFEEEDGKEHLAIVLGEINSQENVLCRLHSECLTGDALFSTRCDCGPQLKAALKSIAENRSGILLYLRQEGRGIGLVNKIKAYALQDQGRDTVEANEDLGFDADLRSYDICFDMLNYFDVSSVNLLTNNPKKVAALEQVGVKVNERIALYAGVNEKNQSYIDTKKTKLGHLD
ncbi:MAG: GTP cyclohydrolase II [Gammaproteobacteria bacterium]